MNTGFSNYLHLRKRGCFNLPDEFNACEVGFLILTTATRICNILHKYRNIDEKLVIRNIISLTFLNNFGALFSPLFLTAVSGYIGTSNFKERPSLDKETIIHLKDVIRENCGDGVDILPYLDLDVNSVESRVVALAISSTLLYLLFVSVYDSEEDIYSSYEDFLLHSFASMISSFSIEEANELILLDEVSVAYSYICDLVESHREENSKNELN